MKSFSERFFDALENQLSEAKINNETIIDQYRQSIRICKKAMSKLKNYISSYDFKDPEEEIHFFKQVKPKFYSKYIYYINIYNYHMKLPPGGGEALKLYINIHLTEIKSFFDHNLSFYQYYRSGSTHQDIEYFTRGGFDVHLELEDFEEDEQYSTSHDYKLSKIIANERLLEYYTLELAKANGEVALITDEQKYFPFNHPVWTAGLNDAVELIYSLKSSGAINNGNIDISELVGIFEFIFQLELKEYYRKFIDISQRKKDIPVFLNKLKDGLIRLINDKLNLLVLFLIFFFQSN
ncbi:RteC domain-containing protein [Mucilaginibacter roseus]|uniref:RteC domain-containing protein n=1 Tax=Mucilaginibacter roseus TaxID=1528868 RepID=A0ABS8TWT8_9SPHI|nr:RteC domain-containing protein [Mucilaginibacter roseus]MCD8739345.1 RteC domain-containing protein [Mucilaginibacter roseus]